MASELGNIIGEVYSRINLEKLASGYVFNNFSTLKAYYVPMMRREVLAQDHPGGRVIVTGIASDGGPSKSRDDLIMREFGVTIGYQRAIQGIEADDFNTIDSYVEFCEQLRDTCRKDVDLPGFTYLREVALKDPETEQPYSYLSLTEGGYFESYHTTFYLRVLAP